MILNRHFYTHTVTFKDTFSSHKLFVSKEIMIINTQTIQKYKKSYRPAAQPEERVK